MEYKSAGFEIKEAPDEAGVFSGYASVFNEIDQGMDTVAPGAFVKSLSARKPKMLWQHDTDKIIGVWDEVREDAKGLFVKGRVLMDVQKGKEAAALLRSGALDSMSIGYRTVEAMAEGHVRKLMQVDLFEVSLVTFPMDERAKVVDVKSKDGRFDPKLVERALRDVCGLSISEAKAFMAEGFKALRLPRDVDASEADAGVKALLSQLRQLQEKIHV
jgi:HK97 family phage prohead protease